MCIQEFILNTGNFTFLLFLLFPVLGAGIKYVDAAFDEEVFNKNKAVIIAPFIGVLWAFTMILHPMAATILLAIILGVLIKGKIDNVAHAIGLISIIIFYVILWYVFDGVIIYFMPLFFLAAAGVLDEIGNDVISYNSEFSHNHSFGFQFFKYFFGRRHFMKVALIYLFIVAGFPLYFFVAFLFFDEAYMMVALYSQSKKDDTI
ncbi:MAG: hypothetical protein KGY67_07150 [Candidatus Thermoplasmatota archaeon]|nr:hypothetical protein [Candidatus Thermoplasmatota archaeon]